MNLLVTGIDCYPTSH